MLLQLFKAICGKIEVTDDELHELCRPDGDSKLLDDPTINMRVVMLQGLSAFLGTAHALEEYYEVERADEPDEKELAARASQIVSGIDSIILLGKMYVATQVAEVMQAVSEAEE